MLVIREQRGSLGGKSWPFGYPRRSLTFLNKKVGPSHVSFPEVARPTAFRRP